MRRAEAKDEAVIPRIKPVHFTLETCARELDVSIDTLTRMHDFESGWKVIGWALSDEVAPRHLCVYVMLLQNEMGKRFWCHSNQYTIHRIAEAIRKEPSRIAQL
ncbi:MAG: hypothetical protein PHG25_00405 [Candidatus Pacebacteria bacterium]|nr:hypothetical protein [Candidatus Paceibacterota bacterium]